MGTRTLGEWWSDLRDALQRPTLDTGKMSRWVNQSMKEFGYAFKFQELQGEATFVTVAGTSNYAVTAGFRAMSDEGIRVTSTASPVITKKLRKENRSQYFRRLKNTTDTQTWALPDWYHTFARRIYLRTIPDAVYTLQYDYWKSITEISLTSDVSPFTDDWDDIVFTGALYRGFRAQGEHARYINIRNDFLGLIRSRVMDEDLEEMDMGGMNLITDPADIESEIDR